MRLVKLCLLLSLVLGLSIFAQAPMNVASSMVDQFSWWGQTPVGCTPGTTGMCVGATPLGDTHYFTAWFADSTGLPDPTGLPIVGMLNDFHMRTCTGNIAVLQLVAFNWSAKTSGKMQELNCLPSFNANQNAGSLWYDHCTSGDNSPGCRWHSRAPFVRGGVLYASVVRQIPSGSQSTRDATLIMSTDRGATWKNPYTVSVGGASRADGDAPVCGSAGTGSANPCADASYTRSILWRGVGSAGNDFVHWQAVQYGQDWGTNDPSTTMPAGIDDGCDPRLYVCFMGDPQDHSITRVLLSDLPLLDGTKFQYYTCPAITEKYRCPGSSSSSWTSNYADRTDVSPYTKALFWSNPVVYIKEFKSYLMLGGVGDGFIVLTAPAIQGPWTYRSAYKNPTVQNFGFPSVIMGVGYSVVSTNPPHIQVTVESDRTDVNAEGSPKFDLMDISLGTDNMGSAMNQLMLHPQYVTPIGARLRYTDSHEPGTLPKKGLLWGFDLQDSTNGMAEKSGTGVFLLPCHQGICGWNTGRGVGVQPYGFYVQENGYGANLSSMAREYPLTAAMGAAATTTGGLTPINAPAALQGNSSFTVVGVYSITGAAGFGEMQALWSTGADNGAGSSMIGLSYKSNTLGPLELAWGLQASRWRYTTGWSPTPGKWYFMACTVQANGASPLAQMWTGQGGVLVDKIAGASRTLTSGGAAETPSVAASPLYVGGLSSGRSLSAAYGGLYLYNRVLSQAEIGLMYQTMRAEMSRRSITLE